MLTGYPTISPPAPPRRDAPNPCRPLPARRAHCAFLTGSPEMFRGATDAAVHDDHDPPRDPGTRRATREGAPLADALTGPPGRSGRPVRSARVPPYPATVNPTTKGGAFTTGNRGSQPEGLHPSRDVAASGFRPLCNTPHCCLPQESGPCLSPSVAAHPLRPATRHRLGGPSPHQQADRPRAHPPPKHPKMKLSQPAHADQPDHPVLAALSSGYPGEEGRLLT